jgi:hypothetical protein
LGSKPKLMEEEKRFILITAKAVFKIVLGLNNAT